MGDVPPLVSRGDRKEPNHRQAGATPGLIASHIHSLAPGRVPSPESSPVAPLQFSYDLQKVTMETPNTP